VGSVDCYSGQVLCPVLTIYGWMCEPKLYCRNLKASRVLHHNEFKAFTDVSEKPNLRLCNLPDPLKINY